MRITFDPIKRARTRDERGLDFEDAAIVFGGVTVEVEDLRKSYGERRIICYIFSMRKANDREKARLAPYFEVRPRES
jgi:uncharacterized DUF497 family protein